jgi:ADP-ribosyl-[dinitrogen reductase] hydrolase
MGLYFYQEAGMNKIATLVGCAVGDALGNPFEMWSVLEPKLKSWDGQFKAGGTFWKGEAGQYTDDTLMSIALATSLIEKNGFDQEHVGSQYLAWMVSGNTRGIGGTTHQALTRIKNGASTLESGVTHNDGKPASGNGTAMRASPIGLWYRKNPERLLEVAMLDASITHNSFEPKMGSVAVALGTAMLATSSTNQLEVLESVIDIVSDSIVKDKLVLALRHIKMGTEHFEALAQIGVNGYVPETVGAAFYCLGACDNYKDTVVLAVKAGGDTDTTAAIAGAMAGTLYGLEGIPSEYKDKVENFELLQSLTDELVNNEI